MTTIAGLENVYRAALARGDTASVQQALVNIAVRDPHRAEYLLNQASAAVRISQMLRSADDETREIIATGLENFGQLAKAYLDRVPQDGVVDAIAHLHQLALDTPHDAAAAMLTALAVEGACRRLTAESHT
jgi:hypothetical protein